MKRFSLFCILLIVFVCFSCNKDNRIAREIKEMIGKNIVFPSGYKLLFCNDSLWEQSSLCDIQIVTYVDNLPCTFIMCWLKKLRVGVLICLQKNGLPI